MKLPKIAIVTFICFFIFVIAMINYFPNSKHEKDIDENMKAFYSKEVLGVIKETRMISHRDYFVLDNNEEYYFKIDLDEYSKLPNDGGYKSYKLFSFYAKIGDSIIKLKNTNYFVLKKPNGIKFKYFFILI
jgi:hypothetical protein